MSTRSTLTQPPDLSAFIREVSLISRRAQDDPAALPTLVAEQLQALIAAGFALAEDHLVPNRARYGQRVLHIDPEGFFSVVGLAWLPGQRTPIHDHVAWCVSGVIRGVEEERRYRLMRDGKGDHLVRSGTRWMTRGEVGVLTPPDEDIHRVVNSGTELAVSLHVYGADIGVLGSSINRTFELPVVDTPSSDAEPVAWRTVLS